MYVVKALFHKFFTIIQHVCKIEFLNVFRNLELWNEDISSDVTNIRFNGPFSWPEFGLQNLLSNP